MSKRGENIYKRKDNRWEGRYVKQKDVLGKPKLGYVYAKTYREVKEKLRTIKQELFSEGVKNYRNLSFFCDRWLTLSRNRIKESTFVKYSNILRRHIKPLLGELLPQKLTTFSIEEFSNSLLLKGLSPKTVKDILGVLKLVLKHCRRELGNEMPYTEIISPKEEKSEMRVLSREEQRRFSEYLLKEIDSVKFGVLLALLTGMRIGEICALRWQDICAEEGCIRIASTMQRLSREGEEFTSKTKIVVGRAKTASAVREIPLSDHAAELCERMRVKNRTAYVLTGEAEKFLEPRALQYRLAKYTAECGLEGVHFHTLRHTFATRCVEVGFELKSLSEILGHANVKVTLDRYVHSSFELKRDNMKKLSAVGL